MSKDRELESASQGPSGGIERRKSPSSLMRRLEGLTGKPIIADARRPAGSVYLLVDCSGSMAGSGKLEQAREGARGFAQQAREQGYGVGLIRFASTADHLLAPSDELDELDRAVGSLEASGSTDLAGAIEIGVERLAERPKPAALCVVTDGMPDDAAAAVRQAERAREAGIDVLTIGTDDADRAFLERIASARELARKVHRRELASAVASAAKLLPGRTERRD